MDVFAQMPDLRVVYLMGNPCVKHIRHYRKMIVGRCKSLKYLDDRPVFDDERRRVDAWVCQCSAIYEVAFTMTSYESRIVEVILNLV